jgi:membrane protein YqaA with SNARE-associated domain
VYWLALISFLESSIFPLPVDLMVIPMVQSNRRKWLKIAMITSIFSVLGGIAGYFLGLWFFDILAKPILDALGKSNYIEQFSSNIETYGAVAVFGAGLTPFPYKVMTIMSGSLKVNFGVFVIASTVSRFLRFFIVAYIVRLFGYQAEEFIKKYFAKLTLLLFFIIIVIWIIIKVLIQ